MSHNRSVREILERPFLLADEGERRLRLIWALVVPATAFFGGAGICFGLGSRSRLFHSLTVSLFFSMRRRRLVDEYEFSCLSYALQSVAPQQESKEHNLD